MSAPEATAFDMLADAIRPFLPAGWRLVAYEDVIDEPDVTTVVIGLRRVQRFPGAPMGAYLTEWTVSVVSPYTDPAKADPSLYDGLLDFLGDLDSEPGLSWLGWTGAEKGFVNGRMAYEIALQTTTKKGA